MQVRRDRFQPSSKGLHLAGMLVPMILFGACNAETDGSDSVDESLTADGNLYCLKGETTSYPGGATTDGPAALPKTCVRTALADTPQSRPPSRAVIKVCPAGQTWRDGSACTYHTIQDAFNSITSTAQCGVTIKIKAANGGVQNVYDEALTSRLNLQHVTAVDCPANNWIIVESDSVGDPGFPAEGTRATPCQVGIASLPDRPAYACPAPKILMPKIRGASPDQPIIELAVTTSTAPCAADSHWRFIGLEFTSRAGFHMTPSLVNSSNANGVCSTDHIIWDRVLVHGGDSPQGKSFDENGSALRAAGTYQAVIDSYLYDTKCWGGPNLPGYGACIDSQAINGGLGDNPQGPIKVVNNFLESSGETYEFGGGVATIHPTDITVRRNHSWKPVFWKRDSPDYLCGPGSGCPGYVSVTVAVHPVVKNLGECKNCVRFLAEGNLYEQNWGGDSDQPGTAVLLTPKNQSDGVKSKSVFNGTFLASCSTSTKDWFNADQLFPAPVGNTHGCPFRNSEGFPACRIEVNGDHYAAGGKGSVGTGANDSFPPAGTVVGGITCQGVDSDGNSNCIRLALTNEPGAPTALPPATGAVCGSNPDSYTACHPGGNPGAIVTDVVFRYNRVSHVNNGIGIAAVRSDCGDLAQGIHRVSVHDDVFDDLDGTVYNPVAGAAASGQVSLGFKVANSNPTATESGGITLNHLTVLSSLSNGSRAFCMKAGTCQVPAGAGMEKMGALTLAAAAGVLTKLTLTNSIGVGGIFTMAGGGGDQCVTPPWHPNQTQSTLQCTSGGSSPLGPADGNWCWNNNVLTGGTVPGYPTPGLAIPIAGDGQSGSIMRNPAAGACANAAIQLDEVTDYSDVGFVKLNAAGTTYRFGPGHPVNASGDYHLCRGVGNPAGCTAASPFINAASDGKDIGADIDAVNQYTAGVQ
jgi:hypothetical protein